MMNFGIVLNQKESNMNKLQMAGLIALLMIVSFFTGAELNTHYSKELYKDYVLVQKTKSGVFYIQNEHIYSVNELQTEQQANGFMVRK